MSKIYEVWSIARSNEKHHSWGARRTRDEAETLLSERSTGKNEVWAKKHHSRWWIKEIDTTGLFKIPSKPTPRECFAAEAVSVESFSGTWDSLRVEITDANASIVGQYTRNYPSLMRTFEPFRQGERLFALISQDYTCTAVIDLLTGDIIASEEPSGGGFCPVGFYVPDWWDLNDDSKLPGSNRWSADDEMPKGDFGFVWGCVWGDDSSWKVQYLDLSLVQQGDIKRDDRFGYVKLAARSDCAAREFIDCQFYDGKASVRFDVEQEFDLSTGNSIGELD